MEIELQQCYKAQSRLSEQLVVEVAESRALTAFLQEKETAMAELEKELTQTRCDCVFYGLACKGDTLFLDLELI